MTILRGKRRFREGGSIETHRILSRRWLLMNAALLVSIGILLTLATQTFAQLNENCTVSILNRTAQVRPDGTWIAINVPANFGQVRARATCVENGVTRTGQSPLFTIPPNGSVTLPVIALDALVNAIPSSIKVIKPDTQLTAAGNTLQLTVIATYLDGSEEDVTLRDTGTNYTNSNTRVVTVSPDGLVTAVASGTVIISALNEGALGLIQIRVTLSGGDADGDGIPDDIETANSLNPNDPTDGFADPDGDGLTNKQELVDYGTRIDLADTDGDSIADGEEVKAGADGFITNPLLRDTDGDGADDNVEIASGSDPTDPNSRPGVTSLTVSPANFVLTVNSLIGEASRQLTVTGKRADGSSVDLTDDPGTNYASSDLNVCNFGAERGRVFAGSDGTCTITVTNNGQSGQATVTVQTFAPTAVSFIALPGATNNVDVSGDFAYVATGAAGLQIVDVANPLALTIAAAVDTPGTANDVAVVGNAAYVADGPAGLRIIDVTDPRNPVQRGALDTPGDAQDVIVKNSRAFVADGASGLQIIDISNPQTPTLLGTVDTPGSASGVDVDLQRNLAVVADGATGIRVMDIADVAHPTIGGNIDTGTAADVAVRDGFAFVADGESSFTVVDLSDPRNPVVRASTPRATGGLLTDVALAGRFGFGSDVFFVNGVPIIDISTPANPIPRAILNFSTFGDDNGTGIAVDSAFVYLTTNRNRLLVGQYLQLEDTAGIPPTVAITAPVNGVTTIEGGPLPVSVDASDDVAVSVVNLLVNGQVVQADTAPPYDFNLTVPTGVTSFTLSAIASDFGSNSSTSEVITINVIPDPLTTATGRVIRQDSAPVQGATVTCFEKTAVTNANGTFTVTNLPTVRGNIRCLATTTSGGISLNGVSERKPPVPGGTVDLGDLTVVEGDLNFWTTATNGNWNTAARWSKSAVPAGNDHAFIDATGTYTVTLDTNPTISALTFDSANATFLAAGRTLTVNNGAHLDAGTVIWRGSNWAGAGTLTNNTLLTVQGASTISSPLVQKGELLVQGSNAGGHTTFTSANGFTNEGTVRLESINSTWSSNLTVAPGAAILIMSA